MGLTWMPLYDLHWLFLMLFALMLELLIGGKLMPRGSMLSVVLSSFVTMIVVLTGLIVSQQHQLIFFFAVALFFLVLGYFYPYAEWLNYLEDENELTGFDSELEAKEYYDSIDDRDERS